MLPWRWEAAGLVRTLLCYPQPGRADYHQQQFLFPRDKDRAPSPGLLPLNRERCTGRHSSSLAPTRGLRCWAKCGSGMGQTRAKEWELHRE